MKVSNVGGKGSAYQIMVILISFLIFHQIPSNSHAKEYISFAAVGDIMMGSTYPSNLLPPNDGKYIFDETKKEFAGNDIVLGNLEGPLYDHGRPVKCRGEISGSCFEFRMPTRYVKYLKESGFNVLNIANNHASDFGTQGIENTIQTLKTAAILPSGGNTLAQFNVRGKKLAVVGFSIRSSAYGHSLINITKAARIVSDLKKKNDIVIVSFHGGREGSSAQHVSPKEEFCFGENRGNVVKFSRAAVDAGADMVIGHGPHVLRAMELYKGKLIAYSLGNFLTYKLFNINGPSGLSIILKVKLDTQTGDFVEGQLVPVKLVKGGIPVPDPEGKSIKIIKRLTKDDFQNPIINISDSGLIKPPAPLPDRISGCAAWRDLPLPRSSKSLRSTSSFIKTCAIWRIS